MAGLGKMPLGAGPYGGRTPPLQAELVTTAVSCRLIDGVTRDYVTDDNGNPVGDDGVADRVYLLLSYGDLRQPIITAAGIAARKAAILAALKSLVSGPSPAISNLSVDITDTGGSRIEGTISYFNNLTQTLQEIDL